MDEKHGSSPEPTEKAGKRLPDADETMDTSSFSSGATGSTGGPPRGSGHEGTDALVPGKTLGPYRIERLLGRGGMGAVYEAVNTETGHRLALKVLLGDFEWSPARRQRFLQEGKLAASISHPNSLYVYGTDEIDAAPVIAMELAVGGTLKDRVEAAGPLPIRDAVEAVLQMLAGLAAAHRAGILHRDVKPANSFVDRDGSVKIGDYGLSLATDDPEATRLTMAGSLMGTPAFASPEQLRGGQADQRTDIYAVGACLYYLLTGRAPFTGADALQIVLATIEQPPSDPRLMRPDIPSGLAELILKCLEKKPVDRFQSCEELQEALADFGAHAPERATLGKRLLAGAIDYGLLSLVSMLVVTPLFPRLLTRQGGSFIGTQIFFALMTLLYPTLTEGLYGATLGKAVMRLRVTDSGARRPGIPRSAIRSLLFWGPCVIAEVMLGLFTNPLDGASTLHPLPVALNLLRTLGWIWVFVPWQRGQFGPGRHDRWTRTGVFQRVAMTSARAQQTAVAVPVSAPGERVHVGPYQVSGDSALLTPGRVVQGIDPGLQRPVWIQICDVDTPATTPARRTLSRAGRLRWLDGRRAADLSWDAYEAVDGTPLLSMGPQAWETVRHWLFDLAQEMPRAGGEDESPHVLALDRVWIGSTGHAILLDFEWNGPNGGSDATPTAPGTAKPPDAQAFLLDVANALRISPPSARQETRPDRLSIASRTPLPLHAREFLNDLSARRFESVDALVEALRGLKDRETRVRRPRIALQLAISTLPAIIVGIFSGIMGAQVMKTTETQHPNLRAAHWCLEKLDAAGTDAEQGGQHLGSNPADSLMERGEALEIMLTGPLRSAIADTGAALPGSGRVVGPKLARRWRTLLAERSQPTAEEITRAQERIGKAMERGTAITAWELGGMTALTLLTLTGLLAIVLALGLRGGILLRVFGIAVVRGDGREVGRVRALSRAAVAWSPVLICWLGALVPSLGFGKLFLDPNRLTFFIPWLLLAGGAIWAVLRPERGPADRVAGTFLVPR
jgi:eukaryotic-like serine/threonine-protein kinase